MSGTMRAGRVHHVAVCVQHLPGALEFYRDALGLEELRRWHREDGSLRSVWLAFGDSADEERAFLAVEEAPGEATRHDHEAGLHCLAMQIDSLDRERWRSRLEAAGYPVERESDFSLYVRDPDGALIALSHWPVARPLSSAR